MPFSAGSFDEAFIDALGTLRPGTLLDIGAGAGKYADLTRSAGHRFGFSTHLTAVEVDPAYVARFDLARRYDTVICAAAADLMTRPSLRFDLVVLGDVIEHLRKSEALDLLEFLYYRVGYLFVAFPTDYEQDAVDGHAAEAHVSVWSGRDFDRFRHEHRTARFADWTLNLFLLEGLQARHLPKERQLLADKSFPAALRAAVSDRFRRVAARVHVKSRTGS